jgi:hypothetical protein
MSDTIYKSIIYFRTAIIFLCMNCLIAVHKTNTRLPINNGYEFRCDKKNRLGSYSECKEEYISRRMAKRGMIIKPSLEDKN